MVSTASSSRAIVDMDSDDEEFEAILNYHPFARSPGRPSTDVASVAIPAVSVEPKKANVVEVKKKEEQSAETIAENNVKLLPPQYRINRPSELYWQVKKQRKAVKVYPLRECHRGEAVGLALPQEWDPEKKALVQFLGRNETNDREVIARSQMIPYCGKNSENAEWCPEHMEKYSKQLRKLKREDVAVLTELKFLDKVLQLAKEKERELAEEEAEDERERIALRKEQEMEEAQKKREKEQEPQQQIAQEDDSDDEDLGSLDLPSECIRAGDVIEYIDPIFKAGDERGRHMATVLSVDRKREFKLVLSDGKLLPDDTAVRRVRIMSRNKLVVNQNSRFRHIELYSLPTSGKEHSYSAGIKNEADRMGRILKKNVDEFVEKTGTLGKDFMINFKGSKETTKDADVDGGFEVEIDEQETLEEPSIRKISRNDEVVAVDDEEGAFNLTTKHRDGTKDEAVKPSKVASKESARRKSHGGKRKSGNSVSVPSSKPNQVDSPQQWIKNLEKQLSNITTGTRRRGPSSHMTACQLGLAIEVRRMLCDMWGAEGVAFDEGLQKLAEELDISKNGLQTFLEGDERIRVGKAQHSETETLLREWKGKQQNKVAASTSQEELQVMEDPPPPPAVTQEGGDSSIESEDDVLDGVNVSDLSVVEQSGNPVVKSEVVETSLMETEISVDSQATNAGSTDADKGKLDDQKKSSLILDAPAGKENAGPSCNGTNKSRAVPKESGRRNSRDGKRSPGSLDIVQSHKRSRNEGWNMNQKLELAGKVRREFLHLEVGFGATVFATLVNGLAVELEIPRDRLKKFLCREDRVVEKSGLEERELKLLQSWLEKKNQDVSPPL